MSWWRYSPLVVLFRGFGPPQTPQALAPALPLEKFPGVLAYGNLPLVARRLPAGDIEELKRVQERDFVNGLFFPCINGAASELPMLVHEIATTYQLDTSGGIGLFDFSAGGAAVLLALVQSDVPVTAAAILNAPLSVEDNVRNWEHALKRPFQWDPASREAANRYNVARHADSITKRKPVSAITSDPTQVRMKNQSVPRIRLIARCSIRSKGLSQVAVAEPKS